jgi:hypothetical protein
MKKITDCYKSDFPGARVARSSASDLAAITPKRITPLTQKVWGAFISGFRKGLNGLDKLPFPVKKPTLLQKREVGSIPTGNPIFIFTTITTFVFNLGNGIIRLNAILRGFGINCFISFWRVLYTLISKNCSWSPSLEHLKN